MANDPGYDAPPPKKSNTLLWVFGGIFGGLTVFCCLPCGGCLGYGWYANSQLEKRVNTEAGVAVTSIELSKAYKDNSSTSTYNQNVVAVTGKVTAKNTGLEIIMEGTPGGDSVKCQASLSKTDLFNSVSVGDVVTTKGICNGNLLGNVTVGSCQTVTKK